MAPLRLEPALLKVHATAFVAHTATLVGDVTLGEDSSVWFGAVLRGDLAPIVVGDRCSVQDGAVVHVDADQPTVIGNDVVIGHGAVVHGCRIGDGVLVGIRAVVLSRARIGANSIIGACALVPEGMEVPPNSLVVGVPGRIVRGLTPEQRARVRAMGEEYVRLTRAYKRQRPDLDTSPTRRGFAAP
ncbi:MAG: gamma carbonic anhydrase family protein [Candidatus Tectimicrobiota bacterium]|nr:MAG: gamma carbonic anhydrase family protein [Candidatus Tectomicrobia bacterium]